MKEYKVVHMTLDQILDMYWPIRVRFERLDNYMAVIMTWDKRPYAIWDKTLWHYSALKHLNVVVEDNQPHLARMLNKHNYSVLNDLENITSICAIEDYGDEEVAYFYCKGLQECENKKE